MKIAITINEVVRDFYKTFEQIYKNQYEFDSTIESEYEDRNENNVIVREELRQVDLTDYNPEYASSLEHDNLPWEKISDIAQSESIKLPKKIDTLNLTSKFPFYSKQDFETFLYDDFAFEIFGRAEEIYNGAVHDLNELNYLIYKKGHKITLISQEIGTSKPATLFFLSKTKYLGNEILFLENYSQVWKKYDLIITSDPYILEIKPEKKASIKIITDYNIDIPADMEFNTIKDLKTIYK